VAVGVGATLRLDAWPNDPTVALIAPVDHGSPVDPDDLDRCVAAARAGGARLARTGALLPDATRLVLGRGWHPIDELALLAVELPHRRRRPRRDAVRGTRRLGRRHMTAAAGVDLAAFGPLWALDTVALRTSARATGRARARRVGRAGSPVVGHALSGVSDDIGYLQRLAVHPDHRRLGIGDALVNDALDWIEGLGCRRAVVNTSVTNTAALDLYRRHGFVDLPERLVVAESEPFTVPV
jgi:ribosomal protein S18 acetylase RimI-like enzyme